MFCNYQSQEPGGQTDSYTDLRLVVVVWSRQKIFINHEMKIIQTFWNVNRNCLYRRISRWTGQDRDAVHFTESFKPQSQDRTEDTAACPTSQHWFHQAEIFPIPWLCCSILFLTVSNWSMEESTGGQGKDVLSSIQPVINSDNEYRPTDDTTPTATTGFWVNNLHILHIGWIKKPRYFHERMRSISCEEWLLLLQDKFLDSANYKLARFQGKTFDEL